MRYVLGIESSCDETAAAVVSEDKQILSNVIYSQIEQHKVFGGVVPETAARAHLEKIDLVVRKAIDDSGIDLRDMSAISATCGPGLIGGVIVGSVFAKSLSFATNIPFIAINHIEAHALSVRATENLEFPYLLMLASGGHCQICIVHDIDNFEILGRTLDDSVGESFDKVSRMLGFGYPGGPAIERMYYEGNPKRFSLPHPLCMKNNCDFSFSGLKTAVLNLLPKCNSEQDKKDLAASFQATICEVLALKMNQAIKMLQGSKVNAVVISGGVAANMLIRKSLQEVCKKYSVPFLVSPRELCTDNGVMIAWLGVEKMLQGISDGLNFAPRPRWELGTSKI